jgi:hypothetical protein
VVAGRFPGLGCLLSAFFLGKVEEEKPGRSENCRIVDFEKIGRNSKTPEEIGD